MNNTAPEEFQDRLAEAIKARGLSLARIRDKAEQCGVTVSVATLSYWTSGRSRPTRSQSLAVVRALEDVLETAPGHLVNVIPTAGGSHSLSSVLSRSEELEAAVRSNDLATVADWRRVAVHYHSMIDVDGFERASETWTMVQAVSQEARGYCVVLSGHAGSVEAEGLGLLSPGRRIQVAEDLSIIEFVLAEPVPRGERVLLGHHIRYLGGQRRAQTSGYALRRRLRQLVVQVSFDGELPHDFTLSHRLQESDEPHVLERGLRVGEHAVQAVITDAEPGLHDISWQW